VSGLSYGIDAAAHRGALAADGLTVAVLGCGVDLTYPPGNALLCDNIVEHGLLISAYPPGTVAARHRLAARGGLLAALTTATVVVEAGPRSGSRAVAATAAALGRPVMAVPGPVTSAMSTGCHDLLRDGTAVLVTAATDILDTLISARRDHPPAPASAAGAA
jgi:DNA processing protein